MEGRRCTGWNGVKTGKSRKSHCDVNFAHTVWVRGYVCVCLCVYLLIMTENATYTMNWESFTLF